MRTPVLVSVLALSVTCASRAFAAGPEPAPQLPPELPPALVCSEGWATRVYRDARASVVRIEDVEGFGAGFVVFAPTYVVTAHHVVALGRPLKIIAADGSKQTARVVATDVAHDVALLELEHPIPGTVPLVVETDPTPVGTPVLAIGHPFAAAPGDNTDKMFRGLLAWTATQGIISDLSEDSLQVDAAVNPGNSGGPLLACDGRVLGVVSAKARSGEAIGVVVGIARARDLLGKVGKEPIYTGHLARTALLGLAIQVDPNYTWVGGSLGFGVLAYDRWATDIRGALLWATSAPATSPLSGAANSGPVLSSDGFRVLGELEESYHALLFARPVPTYLVTGLGIAATYSRTTQLTLAQVSTSPTCAPATSLACQKITATSTHQNAGQAWPMLSAGFLFAQFELSYAFQLDPSSPADSEHRILLAARF